MQPRHVEARRFVCHDELRLDFVKRQRRRVDDAGIAGTVRIAIPAATIEAGIKADRANARSGPVPRTRNEVCPHPGPAPDEMHSHGPAPGSGERARRSAGPTAMRGADSAAPSGPPAARAACLCDGTARQASAITRSGPGVVARISCSLEVPLAVSGPGGTAKLADAGPPRLTGASPPFSSRFCRDGGEAPDRGPTPAPVERPPTIAGPRYRPARTAFSASDTSHKSWLDPRSIASTRPSPDAQPVSRPIAIGNGVIRKPGQFRHRSVA